MLARYAGLTEEFLCCCYSGLSGIWQDVYTMKFWLRLKQLQSWSQNEEALVILNKDRYMF